MHFENIIQKTIDLSRYKSYYPSSIPYVDESSMPYFCDENGNVDAPPITPLCSTSSNYGHYPYDVILNDIGISVGNNILANNYPENNPTSKRASFQTLVLWYRFFKDYYRSIKRILCDNSKYILTSENEPIEFNLSLDKDTIQKFNDLGGYNTYTILRNILEPYKEIDCDEMYIAKQYTCWDINRIRNNYTACDINECGDDETYPKVNECCFQENSDYLEREKNCVEGESVGITTVSVDSCLIPTVNISLCLTTDNINIGEFSTLAEEWIEGEDYNEGAFIIQDGELYRRNNVSSSYTYNEEQRYMMFKDNSYDKKSVEGIEFPNEDSIICGRTESKLENFMDVKKLYDCLGNYMYGSYDEGLIKSDGEQLDLPYHLYNTCNIQKTDIPYEFDNEKYYKVYGDILTKIELYYKDAVGKEINIEELVWDENQGNISKIKAKIDNVEGNTNCDGNVYLRFTYKCGALLNIVGTKDKCHYDISDDDTNYITYTDEKIVTIQPITYQSTVNTSYYIYYFNLESTEIETVENEELNTSTDYNMCYFSYKSTYPFDETSEKQDVSVMLEYKLGNSSRQKVDSDVFVQRGVSSAFEKYLALGSIQSFEALENYQNHTFNIISSNQ